MAEQVHRLIGSGVHARCSCGTRPTAMLNDSQATAQIAAHAERANAKIAGDWYVVTQEHAVAFSALIRVKAETREEAVELAEEAFGNLSVRRELERIGADLVNISWPVEDCRAYKGPQCAGCGDDWTGMPDQDCRTCGHAIREG